MNRLGGRSNTGEGGEDARRSQPDANGDSAALGDQAGGLRALRRHDRLPGRCRPAADQDRAGRQARRGRPAARPQGRREIARLRHSTPGVGLISPPPHHDIYSIEDLAQLIHDLRCVNPTRRDQRQAGRRGGRRHGRRRRRQGGRRPHRDRRHDGGTGASPLSSIKHAGVPWELGLAETQQVLVGNDLRGRVRLQVDGGLRTGRDVLVGALLGAEEFGFSTAPLVAAGCVMMRVCHLNTCPVGIATQDPELRRRFTGTPEHVRAVPAVRGRGGARADGAARRAALRRSRSAAPTSLRQVERRRRRHRPRRAARAGRRARGLRSRASAASRATAPAAPLDREVLALAGDALARGEQVTVERARAQHRPRDRRAALGRDRAPPRPRRAGRRRAHAAARAAPPARASAPGASRGLVLDLEGQANDYVGKGLSGARIVVRPPADAGYEPTSSIAVGNTTLYGATSGELFVRGRAGERFAVRNSGATAVVEGVGDHGCEYMTGGLVAVLGPVGRNFAAGMSGGIAYLWDPDGENAAARQRRHGGAAGRRATTAALRELRRAPPRPDRQRRGRRAARRLGHVP